MPEIGNSTIWSQTDASNNSGTMPGWNGSANPNTIDDAGRAMMGAITREWNWRNATVTAGGTANAKTLTYSVTPAAYYNGQKYTFIANTTNTGTTTLNVNGLGAKNIKIIDDTGSAADIVASQMIAGRLVDVYYNLSSDIFIWTNPPKGLLYLNTLTTTSGTTQSLTGIPTFVKSLYCELNGVSFTANTTLTLAVSANNGSSYGTAVNVSNGTASAAGAIFGVIEVLNLQTTTTGCIARPSNFVSTAFSTLSNPSGNAGASGPYNAIQFAGGTFDAGSIVIYGLA